MIMISIPILITNWVSYNSTKFWYYFQVDSVRFHKLMALSHKTIPI